MTLLLGIIDCNFGAIKLSICEWIAFTRVLAVFVHAFKNFGELARLIVDSRAVLFSQDLVALRERIGLMVGLS